MKNTVAILGGPFKLFENSSKPAFWVPKSCLGGKIWDFTLSDRTRANGTTYLVNCFKPCITVLQLLA